jgi:hypothetical protein
MNDSIGLQNIGASNKLSQMKEQLSKLTGNDFAHVGCLLSLLAAYPKVDYDDVLLGAVAEIQKAFTRLWDDVETIADGESVSVSVRWRSL